MNDPTATPLWRSELFTDEERGSLITEKAEEIRECAKDLAEDQLDNSSIIELISYLDSDMETTIECLRAIDEGNCCLQDYESGEFRDHVAAAEFMKRFSLVTPDGEELTRQGHDYLSEMG